jgi:hypothetical protein
MDNPTGFMPIHWAWPKPPSNDPFKEAMAQRIKLENGSVSLSDVIASEGGRPDQVMNQRKIDNEQLEANGLPKIVGSIPTSVEDYLLLLNDNQDAVDNALATEVPDDDASIEPT